MLLKDSFESGATWAFEVGNQSMICPIIVEDLNTPRQMLVEVSFISSVLIPFLVTQCPTMPSVSLHIVADALRRAWLLSGDC